MTTDAGQPSTLERAVVQLIIFSGRPDPSWELRREAFAELTERLSKVVVQPLMKSLAPTPLMGYRGFVLTLYRPSQPNQWIHVFKGTLALSEGSKTEYHPDKVDLESWLIAQATERGYGDALAEARRHTT